MSAVLVYQHLPQLVPKPCVRKRELWQRSLVLRVWFTLEWRDIGSVVIIRLNLLFSCLDLSSILVALETLGRETSLSLAALKHSIATDFRTFRRKDICMLFIILFMVGFDWGITLSLCVSTFRNYCALIALIPVLLLDRHVLRSCVSGLCCLYRLSIIYTFG